jgi:hypothetical protein
VLDLIDFIEEKLREAIAIEASQAGAVSEAAGALPQAPGSLTGFTVMHTESRPTACGFGAVS